MLEALPHHFLMTQDYNSRAALHGYGGMYSYCRYSKWPQTAVLFEVL